MCSVCEVSRTSKGNSWKNVAFQYTRLDKTRETVWLNGCVLSLSCKLSGFESLGAFKNLMNLRDSIQIKTNMVKKNLLR